MAVDAVRLEDKGEADALAAEYVRRYRGPIERLCRIVLADSSDAEDAAQQTFLLAYQSILAGTRPHNPQAWLSTIARRECWARSQRRRRERTVSQADPRIEPDPAERTVLRAELATISAGLERLPDRQRRAIVLRELGGLSHAQLAAALEVSESAVEALIVRARRGLRKARLALVFLWPFPRSLRRVLSLGSGGAHAVKAVGVTTLVTATVAVGGAGAPAGPIALAPPEAVQLHAPVSRPAASLSHRPVSRPRTAVRHVLRASAKPQRVQAPVSVAPTSTQSPGRAASDLRAVSPEPDARPVATGRDAANAQPTTVPATPSRSHPAAPKQRKRTPAPTKPTTPAPADPTPPATTQPVTAPPPTDTSAVSPAGPAEEPAGSAQNDQGDTRSGNGYGDKNHEHTGKSP